MVAFVVILLLWTTGLVPSTPAPDGPGAGLGLEPPPPAITRPRSVPSAPPDRSGPAVPAGVAALIGGMAMLAARARRISGTEHAIRDALQDSLFSDVGRRDLEEIVRRIEHLDVHEATAAASGLTDDELAVWMRELDGWRGGLGRRERAAYFEVLARRLRPDQLARLTDHGTTADVVAACRAVACGQWQVELALKLWERRGPGDDGWNTIAGLVEDASVDDLGAALAATRLSALGADLFETFQRSPGSPVAVDLEAAYRLVVAARAVPVPAVKAELFRLVVLEAAGVAGSDVRGPIDLPSLHAGLAGLLRSDVTGVVGELNHRLDPHANATSQWIGELIRADRLDQLDVLLAALAGAPDRLGFFTVPGSDPADPYPNASNLGFYVGAYARAIEAIADRAEDRVGLVAQLFAIFTGVIPVPGGGSVGIPLGPLVERQAGRVVDDLRDGVAGLKQTLWGLAKPRTEDGSLWNGAGTSQFQDAWQEVVDVR